LATVAAKYVIFDQGNTLVMDPFDDILKMKGRECVELLGKRGYDVTETDLIRSWTKANKDVNYPHCSHFAQEQEIIAEALRMLDINPEPNNVLIDNILNTYRRGLSKKYRNEPRNKEVKDTLNALCRKGKRLAVFSNDREAALEMTMYLMGISRYFDLILTSEQIGVEKPDPRVITLVLNELKAKAEDCVYVGDDPVRDIDAWKHGGTKAILYRPVGIAVMSEKWRDYKAKTRYQPDAIVEKFSELAEVIV
jgi:putative hydrolase of the HAD superfamily